MEKKDLEKVVRETGERRRRTDPADADFVERRRPVRQGGNGNGSMDVGYGNAHLRLRGPVAMLSLCCTLVGGALVYVNYKGFQDQKTLLEQAVKDHSSVIEAQDMLACVVSLTMEERARARTSLSRDGFRIYCPWLRASSEKKP